MDVTRSGQGPSLLLVDGHAVLLAVEAALRGLRGEPVTASLVCAHALHRLLIALRVHEPSHFLAAFQDVAQSWRTQIAAPSSDWRRPPSGVVAEAQRLTRDKLNGWALANASVAGVDVDDTIGYLANRAVSRGFVVTLLCAAPTLAHLIGPVGHQVDPATGAWLDVEWYSTQYGVPSKLVCDVLALSGHPDLGIPGVPGFGLKRAAEAILHHGTLDQVLRNADTFPATLSAALREQAHLAQRGREALTLMDDVDLNLTPRQIALSAAVRDEIRAMPAPRIEAPSATADAALALNRSPSALLSLD